MKAIFNSDDVLSWLDVVLTADIGVIGLMHLLKCIDVAVLVKNGGFTVGVKQSRSLL